MPNNDIIQGFDDETDENLTIALKKVGEAEGCLLLYLAGTITTYNTHFFQNQVVKTIESGYTKLIFHCGELTQISSSGMGSFLVFLKSVTSRGGAMVLTEMQSRVREFFYLMGFSQVFTIKEGLHESLDAFRSGSSAGFPRAFACPVCSKNVRAFKPGRFRCAACKTILAIDHQGQVLLG